MNETPDITQETDQFWLNTLLQNSSHHSFGEWQNLDMSTLTDWQTPNGVLFEKLMSWADDL